MNVHTPGTHFMHLVVVLVVVIDDWNFVSAQSSKLKLKEEEDRVIVLLPLPPADPIPVGSSLLNKKSTRRNNLSVLKQKLQ